MVWRNFGGRKYCTVDVDAVHGDMIYSRKRAIKVRDKLKKRGYLVRVVRCGPPGDPFWLVFSHPMATMWVDRK